MFLPVQQPATLKLALILVEMANLILMKNVILEVELELNLIMEPNPINAEKDVSTPSVVMEFWMRERAATMEPKMELIPILVMSSVTGNSVVMEFLTTWLLTEPKKGVMMETISMEMVVHLFANLNVVMV
jgi:hypothetical protein